MDGKPLTSWLDNAGSPAAELRASQAVKKAGTNAVPTLLRMLRQRDSSFKCRLMDLVQRQTFVKVHCIPSDERNREAFLGFSALGAGAKAAVPALVEICEGKISWASEVYTVQSLGAIGPAAKMAIPLLLRETTNSHFLVRGASLIALAQIHAKPDMVVPALTNALSNRNLTLRLLAWRSLALLGRAGKQAVPALVKSLSDEDQDTGQSASNALKAIDPEAATKAGVK